MNIRHLTPAAVLFDFDGTLADSEPLITASLILALAVGGFTVTAERVRGVFGPPLRTMLELLAGPLDDASFEQMQTAYFDDYNNRQLPRIQPFPGAVALLDALGGQAVPMAIVTNKFEASARAQLAALGWDKRFAVVVGADNAALPKPAPDPALYALEQLAIEPSAAAFVGDQEPDMACAVAAGIRIIIGLAYSRSAESLAAAGATYVARTLDEVEAVLLRGDSACA